MIRWIYHLLVLGAPRPCGDAECVAESPEEHGIDPFPPRS